MFDKFKKDRVIDYTEQYKYSIRKKPSQVNSTPVQNNSNTPQSNLGFLSDFAQASQNTKAYSNPSTFTQQTGSTLIFNR